MNESGGLGCEYQDDTLPYRKLMCAMIHNAIKNAQGYEMSTDGKYQRCRREVVKNAIAYLLSDDFEWDMELLGLDSQTEVIRRMVTRGTYQMPLTKNRKGVMTCPTNPTYKLQPEQRETIRERYAQGETKAQLAGEFGIHPTSVRDLVAA